MMCHSHKVNKLVVGAVNSLTICTTQPHEMQSAQPRSSIHKRALTHHLPSKFKNNNHDNTFKERKKKQNKTQILKIQAFLTKQGDILPIPFCIFFRVLFMEGPICAVD